MPRGRADAAGSNRYPNAGRTRPCAARRDSTRRRTSILPACAAIDVGSGRQREPCSILNTCTSSTVSDIVLVMTKQPAMGADDAFAADLLRGHTDTIVLGVLRGRDRYGLEIYKTIRDQTGGRYEIKEATLYAVYRRLLKEGLAEAYWGDESQGGRRK